MVDNIEVASSGRATCLLCGKVIGIGTPRVVIINEKYNSKMFGCHKCGLSIMDKQIGYYKNKIMIINRLKREWKSLNKKCRAAIMMEKF